MGWKDKFGFPTQMAMDALGIKKHQTYIKYFNDLVDWGFVKLVQRSTNQYSSNIISLISAKPKNGKALDKAFITHTAKQTESNGQSNSSIYKQETINKEQIGFDVFWKDYQRKVGDKKDCNRKWDKLTFEEQKKIIETLPSFFSSISDKKFYPYPSSYLNQRRWEDEPSVLTNKVDTKAVFNLDEFRNG
jgi:hypothetical protein